jgi:two-component system NtrC family sensor kinase
VAPTGPGERAVHLSWIWPDAASLQTIASSPISVPWSLIRSDPGLLFFMLSRDLPYSVATGAELGEADLRAAARMLADSDVPWVDWTAPEVLPAIRTALSAAHFAELLATATGIVEADRAWTGAWLACTGWLAIGIVEPRAIADWQAESAAGTHPLQAQAQHWGLGRAEVAWGLAAEWPLPEWAQVLLARIDATPADVEQFGGDRQLQAVVQIAIVLAEQAETRLYLADEFDLAAALAELRLRSPDLDRVRETYAENVILDDWLDRPWSDPRQSLGLADRLMRATDRLGEPESDETPTVRVDVYSERVQAAKLAALAEFAAGASHEINNPLAVISGHSQYLLKQESDEERRESLQSIIRQTKRIHAALSELMYFARPPIPRPELTDLVRLVREAAAEVAPLAADRQVEVERNGLTGPIWVKADPKQLSIALAALVRNGVEAAPRGGWVRISGAFRPDRLEIIVEDNGPGPDERSQEHLFDPFYSGRSAGRGRGLGLSAAWRLAKEHGGDVRYVPVSDGPTQFILSLPAAAVAAAVQRKSA